MPSYAFDFHCPYKQYALVENISPYDKGARDNIRVSHSERLDRARNTGFMTHKTVNRDEPVDLEACRMRVSWLKAFITSVTKPTIPSNEVHALYEDALNLLRGSKRESMNLIRDARIEPALRSGDVYS